MDAGIYSNAETRRDWLGWIRAGGRILFIGGIRQRFRPRLMRAPAAP